MPGLPPLALLVAELVATEPEPGFVRLALPGLSLLGMAAVVAAVVVVTMLISQVVAVEDLKNSRPL
jgi:hypothetical protein